MPGEPDMAGDRQATSSLSAWLMRHGIWIPVALALACFAQTLTHDFTYDDLPIVKQNPRIREIANFRAIWLSDWWAVQTDDANEVRDPTRDRLYRPLTLFTFALNYLAGGVAPLGYHAVNVLLHAGVTALVWMLALRLTREPLVAIAAGVLFAVHPVHVEAVAGIVGRAEILSSLFLLIGLIALSPREGIPSFRRFLSAAVAFFLALLAKETAICFAALAAVVLLNVGRANPGNAISLIRRAALLALPLVAYFPLRIAALEGHLIRSAGVNYLQNPLALSEGWERVFGAFTVLGEYVRLFVWPVVLSCDYGLSVFDPARGFTLTTLIGFACALAGVMSAAVWLFRGAPRAGQGTVAMLGLCSAAFLVSYLLISNTILLIGVSLAERLFYWPSLWLCLAVAIVVRRAARERGAAGLLLICGAIAVPLAGRAVTRNMQWRDDFSLFSADVRAHPDSLQINVYYAFLQIQRAQREHDFDLREQQLVDARATLDRAIAINGQFFKAHQGMGIVAERLGDIARAQRSFELAISLNSADQFSLAQLARLRGAAAPSSGAIDELRRRVAAAPHDLSARLELAQLLLSGGRNVDALREYEAAHKSAPEDLNALKGYAIALLLNAQRDQARDAYRRVLERDNSDWNAHVNFANLMAGIDPAATLRHCQEASRLAPAEASAQLIVRSNLAEALWINDRRQEALQTYREILAALPESDANRAQIVDRLRTLEREKK